MNIGKQATWGQASRFLSLVEEKKLKRSRIDELYESGILADVLDSNAVLTNRRDVRTALHLPPLNETWNIFRFVPSKEKKVVINRTDGTMTLAGATQTFVYHDPDLESVELNKPGEPTGPTSVMFYEMTGRASYVKLFRTISDDLDSLVLTQHQIEQFCRDYHDLLRIKRRWTFFLFRENNSLFVALVTMRANDLLEVGACALESGSVESDSQPGIHVVVRCPR